MTEAAVIDRAAMPVTLDGICADLRLLGLKTGDSVLVHTSLSALGWVCGGAVTVIKALMEVVSEQGTIVMPTHSGDLSDPATWRHPPVPESWFQPIRAGMPAYDAAWTPTNYMGRVPELFRTLPRVVRSGHPIDSFAAWGRHSRFVTGDHKLEFGLGDGSPLSRMYDIDGLVLLLGVGFENNTSFHLAEYRLPCPTLVRLASPVMSAGARVWKEYDDIVLDEDAFGELGKNFESERDVASGAVGAGTARLFRQRDAVDFAQGWLTNRSERRDSAPTAIDHVNWWI